MNDIIIIGSGPIGLYASTLASLHNLKGIVIESLDNYGGQLSSLYPEKEIIDLPAYNSISANELIQKLYNQSQSRNNALEIHTNESFISYQKENDYFIVTTTKNTYQTKTILLTTGMGKFTPRKLDLDNNQYSNIIYSIKNINKYIDKKMVILGGGDSAVDWANTLSKIAKEVTIIHRRDEFRAKQESVNQMKLNNVNILKSFQIKSINGNNNLLTSITIFNQNEEKKINLDYLIVNYGLITIQDKLNLEKEINAYKVNTFMQTSEENIFAIGDCCYYKGKVKNITSGLGEAVIAITKIDQIIYPNKNIPTHF